MKSTRSPVEVGRRSIVLADVAASDLSATRRALERDGTIIAGAPRYLLHASLASRHVAAGDASPSSLQIEQSPSSGIGATFDPRTGDPPIAAALQNPLHRCFHVISTSMTHLLLPFVGRFEPYVRRPSAPRIRVPYAVRTDCDQPDRRRFPSADRGSSRSAIASPASLTIQTVAAIDTPGNTICHGRAWK
jgi:hypothetical protein